MHSELPYSLPTGEGVPPWVNSQTLVCDRDGIEVVVPMMHFFVESPMTVREILARANVTREQLAAIEGGETELRDGAKRLKITLKVK